MVAVPIALAGSAPEPGEPRVVVLRDFGQLAPILALANASQAVLAVLRMDEADRRRTLDTLAGWAMGSGGDVDVISRHTAIIRPPLAPPVRLNRPGVVSAVEEAFAGPEHPLTRDEEDRLLPRSVGGDAEARRRLVDSYAEIATVVALWLRPDHVSPETAVVRARRELDQLVVTGTAKPLLVELVDHVAVRLGVA